MLLPHAKQILEGFPAARAIVIQEQPEVIYQEYQPMGDRFYLMPTNFWSSDLETLRYLAAAWPHAFPKYDQLDRSSAIVRYVTEYDQPAERLTQQFPKHVLLRKREDLFPPIGFGAGSDSGRRVIGQQVD
ncbi:MAG: hypothetical protein R3C18_19780 [Planctomycetaceae bacterium]